MGLDSQRYKEILEAARHPEQGGGNVDTMVVSSHLSQMKLFMVRQGLEWFARQDSFNQRREFLRRVVDYNELPGRIEAIIDSHLLDGRGVLYFRPSKDLYRIHWFTDEQSRVWYDEDGAIEELVLIYSFRVRPPKGFGTSVGLSSAAMGASAFAGPNSEIRWVRLRIKPDVIEQTICETKPSFDVEDALSGKTETLINTLGFIPAVEVFNNRGLEAGSHSGEFDRFAPFIVQHDRMVKAVRANLRFFGNPTLVSSRPRHDLVESDGDSAPKARPTLASNSGFVSLNRPSTRVSEPSSSYGGEGLRVPRIIANVEAADRVGYIVPDAVSGDLTTYVRAYQEMIRAALGGVDDLSISSGATAYEVRTLYGRVATTAKRKCRDLFEYGFCKIFSMMIYHEETLFRESLAQALGFPKPQPVLKEQLPPEEFEKAQAKYDKGMEAWRMKVAEAVNQVKETGEIPPDVIGLIPDGDTRVNWRWTGEVFEDSPQDVLNNSIVCRNLQELGVSSIEALQYLFPNKTPEERAAMLSGFPFRMVEASQRSAGVFVDMARAMFQVPHPQEPDLPLAADPQLDLVPYLYRTLDHLRRELSYTGHHNDVDFSAVPSVISDADRLRAASGQPTDLERERTERRRNAAGRLDAVWATSGSGGNAYTAQLGFGSLANGVQPADRRSDVDASAPGLGGALNYDPFRADAGAGLQLGSGTGGTGSADLLAPTNAGLIPQPDPAAVGSGGGSAAVGSGSGTRTRRKR